jgi:carbon monoxide dehydrogenase subunit G
VEEIVFQDFDRTIELTAAPGAVWAAMRDVRRVASWVSIVREVRDVEPPRRYAALLEDRLGPFAMRADLDVTIETDGDRTMRVAAAGEDRQVASRISATIDLSLEPRAAGTVVTVHGRYEITGRIATLGSGAIRKKGDKILEKFFANLGRELGARDLTADPAPS